MRYRVEAVGRLYYTYLGVVDGRGRVLDLGGLREKTSFGLVYKSLDAGDVPREVTHSL